MWDYDYDNDFDDDVLDVPMNTVGDNKFEPVAPVAQQLADRLAADLAYRQSLDDGSMDDCPF